MRKVRLPSDSLPFPISTDWSPAQALAVVELFDHLRQSICAHYQLPLQPLIGEHRLPNPRSSQAPDLRRFLQLAQGDTSGSRRLAQVLLSLWDGACFRSDLQDLLNLDRPWFDQTLHLLRYLHRNSQQLDSILSNEQMLPVIQAWGPCFDLQIP